MNTDSEHYLDELALHTDAETFELIAAFHKTRDQERDQ